LLKLLAFVLPLGLDSFGMAAALGTRNPRAAVRWRLTAVFVLFEAGMPLVGLAAGAPLAHVIGATADYAAGAVLIVVGAWMVFADDRDDEAGDRMLDAGIWTALAVGFGISLDELAIGFTLGLAGVPAVAAILAIAVQAVVASQLGLALGSRISQVWRDRAERFAGGVLVPLGVYLLIRHLW
jgi:putative Mn2+ efflux pump MntP